MKNLTRSPNSPFGGPTTPKRSFFRSLTPKSGEPASESCQLLQGFVASHPDLSELNTALDALAAVFPDVQPEVLREMLMAFSGKSRLYLVADQLLQHKAKWVKDRWKIPGKRLGKSRDKRTKKTREQNEVTEVEHDILEGRAFQEGSEGIPLEDRFRSKSYKSAVRTMLCQEFKGLSKSTVDGVLAEQNFSYTLTRPILLGLATKTWRFSLSSLFSRWQTAPVPNPENHFMLIAPMTSGTGGDSPAMLPTLRPTASLELDAELVATVLEPLRQAHAAAHEEVSATLACELNEEEAAFNSALYECECCYGTMTFEAMCVCTTGEHKICFTCIQRSVSEAVYGQSWMRNIDHTRGQIACIAPSDPACKGCISQELAQRAILAQKSGAKVWTTLQEKILSESLQRLQSSSYIKGKSRSGIERSPLVQCPFCFYAESSDFYLPQNTICYRINTLTNPLLLLFLFLSTLYLIFPIIFLSALPSFFTFLPNPQPLLDNAFKHLHLKTYLSPRFKCRNPACKRLSCLHCQKAWRDPHICYESARLSLRTTIEAARTAALKRTCPRCGVGFVKSSGCNKMVCVCGYTMCYVCRQGLGSKGPGGEDGEGYRHFCQHFRPKGGKCGDCDKCDLYKSEDEDEIVNRAGDIAEREWRIREGFSNQNHESGFAVSLDLAAKNEMWGGDVGLLQKGVNWWVETLVRC